MSRHTFLPVKGPVFVVDVRDPPPVHWMIAGEAPKMRLSDFDKPLRPEDLRAPPVRRFTRRMHADSREFVYVEDGAEERPIAWDPETGFYRAYP